MRLTLLILFLVVAYWMGEQDGRVSECRRSFTTVEGAITVWDECEQRIGLSTDQAIYRLTHLWSTRSVAEGVKP